MKFNYKQNESRAIEVKMEATSGGGYWLAGEEKDF